MVSQILPIFRGNASNRFWSRHFTPCGRKELESARPSAVPEKLASNFPAENLRQQGRNGISEKALRLIATAIEMQTLRKGLQTCELTAVSLRLRQWNGPIAVPGCA